MGADFVRPFDLLRGTDKVNVLLIIFLALAVAALYWLRKSGADRVASQRPSQVQPERSVLRDRQRAGQPLEPGVPHRVLPLELDAFHFVDRTSVSDEVRQAILIELRKMPRPPLSLYKLLSPEFLSGANSNQISELIMGEAAVAAKVLARVNSPFYGLSRPVQSLGQAVTFLGLNGVRSVALQHMLEESFEASTPARARILNIISNASALAAELLSILANRLNLPEQGALVTQGVLSSVGHLAAASLMPVENSLWTPDNGLLERAEAEQDYLGLSAAEIGSLLMMEWGLPISIVEEVRSIDRILLTPANLVEPERGQRLALCYLCARLGERLALGSLSDLTKADPTADYSTELFHLRSYLASGELAKLQELFQSPELAKRMSEAMLAVRQ